MIDRLKRFHYMILPLVVLFFFIIALESFGAGCTPTETTNGGGIDNGDGNGTPVIESGIISGAVKDAVSQAVLSGVTVTVTSQGVTITTATTDSNGAFSITISPGSEYKLEFTKSGYMSVTVYNVSVSANTTTILETVQQISEFYSGTGDASGTITDAFSGYGVYGLTLKLRQGINAMSGTVVATVYTDYYGYYEFTVVNAGNYTAEVSGSGYTTVYFSVLVIGGMWTSNQNATITETLAAGQIRIVLTWGETPYDLDSHLTGPISGSTERFHVYFMNMGYSDYSPYVELDVDDTYSYGPETITIYQQFSGVYRYYVHDYSNGGSTSSTALSSSDAQVKVYDSSGLIVTYNVPQGQGGTLWYVFDMSGSTITPVNTMSYWNFETELMSVPVE